MLRERDVTFGSQLPTSPHLKLCTVLHVISDEQSGVGIITSSVCLIMALHAVMWNRFQGMELFRRWVSTNNELLQVVVLVLVAALYLLNLPAPVGLTSQGSLK